MTIATLVLAKRKSMGLSQAQAARLCGLTAMTLSNIERGVGGILLTTFFQLVDGLALDVHEVINHARG